MRRLWGLGLSLAFWAATASVPRDYVPSAWTSTFYRPEQARIEGVGLVNEDVVFFQTRSDVSTYNNGFVFPVIEAPHGDEITAFHVCQHRSSFFYEVRAHEGGSLSIFEYSLVSQERKPQKVGEFQDTVPATALACVDHLLLRASRASVLSVHLQTGAVSILRKYDSSELSDTISSLTVGYAADVASRAKIFAVVPHNRSVVRLHLSGEDGALLEDEVVVKGGDGIDGPLSQATSHEPLHVLWSRGKVLFVDGCSLREIDADRVRTLVGSPGLCPPAANETVEPMPWASQLSRPLALATTADSTALASVLLLTGEQVVEVVQREDPCSELSADADCSARNGCGWAEGPGPAQQTCFSCSRVQEWAARHRPALDMCKLELAPRASTRYSLTGCGCVAPPPAPTPAPDPAPAGGEDVRTAVQVVLAAVLLCVGGIAAVLLYRGYRRAAAMRELYGVDFAEFHTFNDDECFH